MNETTSDDKQPGEAKPEHPGRRHKLFTVRPDEMFDAIRGRMPLQIAADLPADACVVRALYNIQWDSFCLLVESAEFESVPLGQWAPSYLGPWCYPPEKANDRPPA